jgi:hypothetical protein
MSSAPSLEMGKLDQVPALPLGGRVKVNPWTDQAELVKSPAVPLASAREKMIFEVTPVFPHLTREAADAGAAPTVTQPATQPPTAGAAPSPASAAPQPSPAAAAPSPASATPQPSPAAAAPNAAQPAAQPASTGAATPQQ